MITQFKTYESNGSEENKHKFFFRKHNRDARVGNICILLSVENDYTPKGGYELKVINIPYSLDIFSPHNYKKVLNSSIFKLEILHYSEYTWNRLEFLTPTQLFYNDQDLATNLHFIFNLKDSKNPNIANNSPRNFNLVYNLLKEIDSEIEMNQEVNKYNL